MAIGKYFHCGWSQASMCAKKFFNSRPRGAGRVRELTQRRATLEDVFVELTHPDEV